MATRCPMVTLSMFVVFDGSSSPSRVFDGVVEQHLFFWPQTFGMWLSFASVGIATGNDIWSVP